MTIPGVFCAFFLFWSCSPFCFLPRCWVSLRQQALLLCLWSTLWVMALSSLTALLPQISLGSCQLSWWATSSSIHRLSLLSVSFNLHAVTHVFIRSLSHLWTSKLIYWLNIFTEIKIWSNQPATIFFLSCIQEDLHSVIQSLSLSDFQFFL